MAKIGLGIAFVPDYCINHENKELFVLKTKEKMPPRQIVVSVTTLQHTTNPFYNGAKELQETYQRIYAFDYKKACCNQNDFEFVKLD